MKCQIPAQFGMDQRIVGVIVLIGRVDSLHAQVETQDEIVKVQSKSQTVAYSHVIEQSRQLQLAPFLFGIITESPDIARIEEQGAIEFPKQVRAILQIQVKFHVARLRNEVNPSVLIFVTSRSQTPYAPTSHTVGTASKIALLKRQHPTIAIRIGHTEPHMEHQLTVVTFLQPMDKVHVGFYVLGKSDVKHHRLPETVLRCVEGMSIEVQQVACCL